MKIQAAAFLTLTILLASCAANGATGTTVSPLSTGASPTLLPTLAAEASFTALKYQVLLLYPNLFFCDPDFFPVAHGDEAELALQAFPELQANSEEFQAILDHNQLGDLTTFTDEQKLLIYREHKKLGAILFEPAGSSYQFQIQVEEDQGQGWVVKGLIDPNGSVTDEEKTPTITTCPICLALGTQIDTPGGPVAVEKLRVGDAVWTADATGRRTAALILKTGRMSVPSDHPMVHIVLSDGRELRASPGHPTSDGRVMGDLHAGDVLDGSRVIYLEVTPYDQGMTYDILPAGGTGFYWANGILVGSTFVNGGEHGAGSIFR